MKMQFMFYNRRWLMLTGAKMGPESWGWIFKGWWERRRRGRLARSWGNVGGLGVGAGVSLLIDRLQALHGVAVLLGGQGGGLLRGGLAALTDAARRACGPHVPRVDLGDLQPVKLVYGRCVGWGWCV